MEKARGVNGVSMFLLLLLVSSALPAQQLEGFETYGGMKDQFEIALPVGWSVYDQTVVLTGKPAKTGPPVVFASELIDGKAMMSGDQEL
jgi:hypothetical protein